MRLRHALPALVASLLPALALAAPAEPAIAPGPWIPPVAASEPVSGDTSTTPAPDATAPAPTQPDPAATPADPAPPVTAPPTSPPPVTPPPPSEPLAEHELQPRHRISYANTLIARLNPLGAEDRLTFMYHRRLVARTGQLWEDSHVGIGLTPSFAPSIVRLGGTLQVVPLAILHLKASYYFITYFGEDKFKAHPFNSPNANSGPAVIEARHESGLGLTTWGGQAELSALLQAKVGPIAIRNETTFFHNNIKVPAGNDVFYDLRHDILAPARGWVAGNDSDLLYINKKIRLTAGVRGTYFHNFYPDSFYEPGDVDRDDRKNDIARVGPIIAYSFKDRPQKRFLRPTLYLVAQWWVKHRFRTGQEVSQALPMIVLGFSFTGDLWKRQ